MRLVAHSFAILKAHQGLQVQGQHTIAHIAWHLKDVLDHFQQTDSRLHGFTTDKASSNYSMTCEVQITLEASRIEWPKLRNHTACMAYLIQLALGEFISSLGVNCRIKSQEAHECDQQCGENKSTDIGKSERLRTVGNARMYNGSAMRPGLAKIIEKVRISWYFENAETDLHIAEIACCIDYTDTWSSKRVYRLSQSQSPDHSTTHHGWEETFELDSGVARGRLLMMWIHMRVA